ncbi:Fibropellin-3,Sushi, von Willebrand factor type A, EGF and pentraxin domain-containing protein 1,Fibropellin-1 [Mytilus edulis]|uniref:Fibropellin-3,Sushi, von Willebrand factor type A, EGF and pentraxin domain-containing protein 1,Fibropellin-1 n=1 Tax=Mytilus edulis TaxID=6550 RepID=A0A8S3PR08_MYTED|nr:Fibropellin-3,Sushi, von Willebrand factor type A, EGF and pentraxin domain-containing protein 1,Fibropellin-1 [Mytilus edulis]
MVTVSDDYTDDESTNASTQTISCIDIQRYRSLEKAIRVTAYVLRFIQNLRNSKDKRSIGFISVEERCKALKVLIVTVQQETFKDEIESLNSSSQEKSATYPKVCSNDICNNGTCMPMDSGRHFVCNCLPGFIGAVCDVNVQECDSNPCVNGDCVDGYDSYSCTCYQGYTGHNCETSINDCSLNTCSNGTCIDGVNSSSCLCYDGFTGDSSCVEKTECDPNTCEHGGLCIDLIDDFICNCSGTGYVGKNCSMLPERCYNGSCLNDGVCHPHVSGYSCSCAQGYTGEYCQINIDECQGHYCRNHAVCVDGVNSYTCLCQPGYNGSHCNYNTMCDTSPCVNGASCQTTLTGFMCNCLLGYSGVLCEVNIDECKQNNCNPDTSQCVDQINSYTCNCLPGWTGEFCDEPTNECLLSPCAHSSQCFDHENQFSCSCVDGYTGHNCSTQVIECDSHPCYNDGQCLDQVNGYRCTCKGSFTGSQCEKHIDLCVGSPCLHNGTCQELVDTFLCKCEVGWTGSRCESLIDNCVSLPCYNNAVCINGINQYTCVCKPGYTGSHCQLDIDECLTDPCLHEGVCTNLIGGYYCTCPDGYTGTDCADLDIPCPSCQNGAIECFNGECVCLPGFIGPDCGKEVNPDFDLYFHGNSRIDTGVKRIKNRNQFSVCLWYKAFGLVSSMPVLTLVAVNGNREDDVLSIYSDRIHLSYFRQTEFNISVTPRSWNHLCVTWDSHDSGHWSVYINGWIQVEGNEFGNGQELPQRQKLVFGQATEDSNSTFHGMISQVNLYDTVLNESEITKGGKNCSISMPVGSVFRWQEFTSYISTETAGVNVIEPSLCGSDECPLSYEGEWCNTTEDTEAPTVIYCPEYVQVVTANRLNIVNWTEPQFTDNVGIINVVQTHRSGQVFAYGEYDVMYIAYDTENNTAICSFTVYVIPFNCSLPAPPSNVILTCSTWPEGLQCSVKCQDPRIQSFVEEVPSFYKCGREGFWDPPRGREFNFPTCAESSSPDGTIKGELVYLGPPCTLSSKQILNESFVKNMNNWNMEFGLCPEIGCNFSNITILCMSSGKRRRRSTKSTYNVTFDIPVNGSLMSDGVNALPLTQLETMIKNEEFNTDDFSCDAEKLVVKPYIKCQIGQILIDTTCVNCIRGTYYDNTNELCGVCPVGQYTDQERQTTCKSCALGYTTESSGTTSSTLCYKTCNIGNYYDKRLLDCKPCERGYYQDVTGKTTCKSCGNGQTTENTGSTSVTYCQNSCRAGTELSVSGTCELCAQGTYKSDDSQDTCQPCPYGFSTQNKGATSVQQCSVVSCPPDYKYDSATEKCVVCPPGYHQPYQGQSSCIPCIPKLDIGIKKCSTGEIDECAIHQDNCDDNAECTDTKDSFECQCKFGFKGNGTTCIDKCIGACYGYIACIIDNSGEPQCKQDTSDTFPLIAVAGGGASFVLIIILMIVVGVCRRRSNQKKRKETPHNYQHMDRVHRELEVVTYPRGLPRTVQFSRNNPAYSDSDLSDPTAYHRGQASAPIWARPVFPDHEDLSKYSETSLKRPLRLRITEEMKNDQQFEIESNKSWHDSSPGSSLSQYRDDTHHSSPNSSISKYRVDSNPKDSSPSSSISQYKEDSLHKNDSPISNKSDFSDSFF